MAAYYSDPTVEGGPGVWPTWDEEIGDYEWNDHKNGSAIEVELLMDAKYISEYPRSCSKYNKSGLEGSYTWYIDADGRVQSVTEEANETGYQPDVGYP